MLSTSTGSAPAPAAPPDVRPGSEGCPTPLDWQEVLATFREQRAERLLKCGEHAVRVFEFGSGDPLAVIGAAAGNRDLFALAAWLLRDERRLIMMELPDLPRVRSGRDRLRSWGRIAADAIAATSGRAPVWGTMWGGLVALQAALDRPEAVERLILQGTAPEIHWSLSERCFLSAGRWTGRCLNSLPFWRRIAEANHRPWFPPFDPGRWGFLCENLGRAPVRRLVERLAAYRGNDVAARLEEVGRQALVIRTEGEGPLLTAAQEAMAARLPHVHVQWMHTAGHYPHVTHPHRLVKLLRDFLATPLPH